MGEDLFDFFGGMANLPDDAADDELDLSDLKAKDTDSGDARDEREVRNAAADESTPDTEGPDVDSSSAESGAPQRDESHWMDLASSLGIAGGSTTFESSTPNPSRAKPRPTPPKKQRSAAKPTSAVESDDDTSFGRGLLDDVPESAEEHRQKELLSNLFVPTGETFDEPASEIREVDDVEIIDDEIVETEALDEEKIDDDARFEDEDMVEFEVEELSSGDDQRRGEFGRRAAPQRESQPRHREEKVADERPHEGESTREREPRRGRDEGPRQRPRRGDRNRQRPTDRPPHHEKKVRSQVLPADEDFIIDPVDEPENEGEQPRSEASATKSIKFPTWEETVNPIIEANIARRGKSKGRPQRRPPNRDR